MAFQNAQVCLGAAKVALNNLTLDLGNTTSSEDDPNAPYGASVASITARGINGSMALPKGLESARNVFDSWSTGVKSNLSIIWGGAAGNRGAVLVTDIIYTGLTDQDINGLNYDNLPFSVDAQDSSVYICYW